MPGQRGRQHAGAAPFHLDGAARAVRAVVAGRVKELGTEEDARTRRAADADLRRGIDLLGRDRSPARLPGLLVGDLVAAGDEGRRAILASHFVEADQADDGVRAGELLERGVAVEGPVADA